eukprot:CAMPEP_0115012540 /NCGR_PEP_ID=MMETSP0216-20121206/24806_1 /TAXON_ID=223996 /ORGANISM="Protocruzia adherens, Strain Boccale" /LENGTH=731 /DNA_ID=CAMNT_0002381633 /DNA_START=194 /DNA_END=2389 /DNA_ORIENTATION=-
MSGKKQDFEMTRDEMNKIAEAMKKEEFRNLFVQYMEEISDPKNREEQNAYLEQLEGQGELPQGTQLMKPEPGFCMKTFTKRGEKKSLVEQKCFVNICSSEMVDKPTSQPVTNKDGAKGSTWQLPHVVSKGRPDQDNKKEICMTYDVIFNPEALKLAKAPRFREFLCDTALNSLQKSLVEGKETVSKNFKILQNMKCKGGEPGVMTFKTGNATTGSTASNGPVTSTNDYKPKMYHDIINQQDKAQATDTVSKEEASQHIIKELASAVANDRQEGEESQKEAIKEGGEEEEEDLKGTAIRTPKYSIVYSNDVEYIDFIDKKDLEVYKYPKRLTLTIELPRIKSAKEAVLDVQEKALILEVGKKYYLDIKLPYAVIESEGTAKFDKTKKRLAVTLPIRKPKLEDIMKEQNLSKEGKDEEGEETIDQSQEETTGEQSTSEVNVNEQDTTTENTAIYANIASEKHSEKQECETENQAEQENEPLPEVKYKTDLAEEISVEDEKTTPLVQEIESSSVSASTDTNPQEMKTENSNSDDLQGESGLKKAEYNFKNEKFRYFFIISAKSYKSDKVKYLVQSESLLVEYNCLVDGKLTHCWLSLALKEAVVPSKSQVSLVTDYIVINLVKKTPSDPVNEEEVVEHLEYEESAKTAEILSSRDLYSKHYENEVTIDHEVKKQDTQQNEVKDDSENKEASGENETPEEDDLDEEDEDARRRYRLSMGILNNIVFESNLMYDLV